MHNQSLPPSDRDDTPALAVRPVRIKAFNEELRATLKQTLKTLAIPQAQFAQRLGVASSALNKYLTRKPEGDVGKLEARIIDVMARLKSEPAGGPIGLVKNEVAALMANFFNRLRDWRRISVVHGPAGIGKTSGVELYVKDNPSAILITASEWSRGGCAILSLIWNEVDTRGFPQFTGQKRGDFLVNKFNESGRLLIIDNAHRLSHHGFNFVFDLHDKTRMPVALVGNPEIIKMLKNNDQHFSRLAPQLPLGLTNAEKQAREILQLLAPESTEEVIDLATEIVRHQGHFRALEQRFTMGVDEARKTGSTLRAALIKIHPLFVGSNYALGGGK